MSPAKKAAAKVAMNPTIATSTEVEALRHPADVTRANIPTSETSSLMAAEKATARPLRYKRKPDLDPQLVWRGKDAQDDEDLSVSTVPIYIQEKVLPEALIRDLHRQAKQGTAPQADLFGDFDWINDPEAKLEFYEHAENWSNRMILGDSLLVMNSLAEKEGLRGQVQMIYLDPPYGIGFGSNWQPSTKKRSLEDGKLADLTREPEQIKAFRDTWRDGIHSYLSFWRDRLTVARELLSESGSIFVQIGDENLAVMQVMLSEVFGADNTCGIITFAKTAGATSELLPGVVDHLVWYAKSRDNVKYRQLHRLKEPGGAGATAYTRVQLPDGSRRAATKEEKADPRSLPQGARICAIGDLTSSRVREGRTGFFPVGFEGQTYLPPKREWSTHSTGMHRLVSAGRVAATGSGAIGYVRFLNDFAAVPMTNLWTDTLGQNQFGGDKVYVVQTALPVVIRAMVMTTDPGDLVLDPTCGSGTTAVVAEQWGRRWVTIDTSRVALALARTRLMAGRHPAYLLRDSGEGAAKEAEMTGLTADHGPFLGDIRQGFVLERVPHVTLKSIANNAEIDLIHEKWQPKLDCARATLNVALGTTYEEWQVPRTLQTDTALEVANAHAAFWKVRVPVDCEH